MAVAVADSEGVTACELAAPIARTSLTESPSRRTTGYGAVQKVMSQGACLKCQRTPSLWVAGRRAGGLTAAAWSRGRVAQGPDARQRPRTGPRWTTMRKTPDATLRERAAAWGCTASSRAGTPSLDHRLHQPRLQRVVRGYFPTPPASSPTSIASATTPRSSPSTPTPTATRRPATATPPARPAAPAASPDTCHHGPHSPALASVSRRCPSPAILAAKFRRRNYADRDRCLQKFIADGSCLAPPVVYRSRRQLS